MTITLHRIEHGTYLVRLDGVDVGPIAEHRGKWSGWRVMARDRDTAARALADVPASTPVTIGAHVRHLTNV